MAILEGTESVLIVDDETFMLSLAELMLTRLGYTVLTATRGEEVLHMLDVWPDLKIDVAVVDVVMPLMDGFELAERMRKIRPRLPILYMSAYPEKAELRPEQTRNIPFVPKPFTSLKLAGKIREVLDSPQSRASTQI
ncbi:MAG: sensor hybrid histidine kinase [Bryobacterales bacterium]|nr:sensor hybrid histidine kinase [Bryobacterales bacterium]